MVAQVFRVGLVFLFMLNFWFDTRAAAGAADWCSCTMRLSDRDYALLLDEAGPEISTSCVTVRCHCPRFLPQKFEQTVLTFRNTALVYVFIVLYRAVVLVFSPAVSTAYSSRPAFWEGGKKVHEWRPGWGYVGGWETTNVRTSRLAVLCSGHLRCWIRRRFQGARTEANRRERT